MISATRRSFNESVTEMLAAQSLLAILAVGNVGFSRSSRCAYAL
jgi:hypothetical protein